MWVSEVYRRNDKSPYKGIDTRFSCAIPLILQSRNDKSPYKGIDTFNEFCFLLPIHVEMIKARIRALTHVHKSSFRLIATVGRNDKSSYKGIDTLFINGFHQASNRRNDKSPYKGIDTVLLFL